MLIEHAILDIIEDTEIFNGLQGIKSAIVHEGLGWYVSALNMRMPTLMTMVTKSRDIFFPKPFFFQ